MARSQVAQMCEEVASRVERAARRLRPPAWFRLAAASPRGFLLSARRPSRLPPWPALEHDVPTPATGTAPAAGSVSGSGSRSAPATLTRRRDRQRAADAAEEEAWSRDAATLYATPLSSRRQRPQSDWQTAPLGGWDSTPPRRHRSQLTLRTASPAPASDAGWSQEARRPYMGWRSLERLSRRPWTPEERLAASLLERSGRSTPSSVKEATAPKKQSNGDHRSQPPDADASRERTAAQPLRNEPALTPTPHVTSGRTEQSHKLIKEPSPLSRRITTLSITDNQHTCDAETPSSGSKSAQPGGQSTGNLTTRSAEEDSSGKWHTVYQTSQDLKQDTVPNVQKVVQHNGLPLPTQIKTLPLRTTDHDVDLVFASHKDLPKVKNLPNDTHHFLAAERNNVQKTQYTENTPEKFADPASQVTREEKDTRMEHRHLNGPSQLPTQLKALSVTTRHSINGADASTKDNLFPARDLLVRSYEAAPLRVSNTETSASTTLAPTTSNAEDDHPTRNHVSKKTSPLLRDRTFTIDQSLVSDSGNFRRKQLPTVELRTRSLEVTLPQRMTTSDTSSKLSIQEQFWIADDNAANAVQEDSSLVIVPPMEPTVATAPAKHSISTSNRKSAPLFPTSSSTNAIDTSTLPYPVQFDDNPNKVSSLASGTKPFDINQLRSVKLRTRSVEVPLPQVTSTVADSPGTNFSQSAAIKKSSVPNVQEGSPRPSATIRATSMPPVPRDRTFVIESPSMPHKGTSAHRPSPTTEFQRPPSDITLVQKMTTVATARPISHRHETQPTLSGVNHRHTVPASPLVETSLTTIHVTPSPAVSEYRAVYPDSSPLLGRKPFTVKHVEAPSGMESSAKNSKSHDISLSSALPKPFEPMVIPHSKIPVPTGPKIFSEKETVQTDTSHQPLNHNHPTERTQKSSVTSVIRRPSYRTATRNEFNPSFRKKRSTTNVNTAGAMISKSVVQPTENHRFKAAPIQKPPRLHTSATNTPKPPPRQKHSSTEQATQRSDNVEPIAPNAELHLPNGTSPLPYSALRITDSPLPQTNKAPTKVMSVSFKIPISSESDVAASKGSVLKQSTPPLQKVPNPSLLTPLKYKPCTTTDL